MSSLSEERIRKLKTDSLIVVGVVVVVVVVFIVVVVFVVVSK